MAIAKPERKLLPQKTVADLVQAMDKIHDRLEASPKLKDLYDDGFNRLMDTITANVEGRVSPL